MIATMAIRAPADTPAMSLAPPPFKPPWDASNGGGDVLVVVVTVVTVVLVEVVVVAVVAVWVAVLVAVVV